MPDLYFTLSGDLAKDGNNDIGLAKSRIQMDTQQIYMRLMTEPGDFNIYPELGIDLSPLYGMPQRPETGEMGKRIIQAGLQREGLFKGRTVIIDAVPTSADEIRFDIQIVSDTDQPLVLSINQKLGE